MVFYWIQSVINRNFTCALRSCKKTTHSFFIELTPGCFSQPVLSQATLHTLRTLPACTACPRWPCFNKSASNPEGPLILISFTIMCRMYECVTKAKLSFSGGPHTPVNMAGSIEERNAGGKKKQKMACLLYCTVLYISYANVFTNL